MTATRYRFVDTPIGNLLLAGIDGRLALIGFPDGPRAETPRADWRRDDIAFTDVAQQLNDYFDGRRTTFDLQLAFNGTAFQNTVWRTLMTVPFGTTTTYGAMAAHIGKPKASRAVGAANGANPLPIIVPCHRLVGSNGSLIKFGGGLARKQFLLDHEQTSHRIM